ncbi:MAG: AfsR/SARP family transcriptional regulator [Pseudonocardiaceae bacterium]
MDELQIRLFGDVSVQQKGRSISFPSGKALELFCYLLIHRDRPHTREALSEVLWPDGKSASAKGYLRQALWRLNATVRCQPGHHRTESELLLIIEPDWVRINTDAAWWLDVNAFERAYVAVRDVSGHSLSLGQAQSVESALELYRGDLMATRYHDWCGYERDRLQLAYLAMLDQLMCYCEAQQLYTKGLSLGQTVLRYDPARECTHRQLMRLYYRAGDRTSAIRQYERCTSVMAREFGVQPSAGTVALYEQICADWVPDTPMSPSGAAPVAGLERPERTETAAIARLHLRLDQIQASLYALQESVLQSSGVRWEHARTVPSGSPEKNGKLLGIGSAEEGP